MDIKRLLEKKKKELVLGIKTTDPVSSAYKLGAYNLCDELLNVISQNKSKQKPNDLSVGKTRWAIKEEPFSTNFNIVTGGRDAIGKCISRYIFR
ncbi:hypothetical protein ABFV83_09045 [Lacrimispora sp. BS-2]|uniref:Uncharacterized protein n=1 Tax=Lacrimispora sp. BS-2 TaxID=3151850 RepID=A0AAU7PU64_9FIRM